MEDILITAVFVGFVAVVYASTQYKSAREKSEEDYREWKKSIGLLLLFAFMTSRANAQSLTYDAGYFAPGVNVATALPVQVVPLTVTCNLTFSIPNTPSKVTNPARAEWDDPTVPTKACRATVDAAGTLASSPVGLDYQFALRAKDGVGTPGPWSVPIPFDLRRPPAIPTGVRIGS